MGGSASRELEAAQSQVRRLTADLQRAQGVIKTHDKSGGLVAAAEAAQKALRAKLSRTEAELSSTTQQLHAVSNDVPRIKREVATVKEQLLSVRRSEQDKGTQLTALQQELRVSKEELEALFGKLKYAEQEGSTLRKLRADVDDEKRALAEQQKAAAEASVRLVTEASVALVDAEMSPHAQHPVFGELLHDFGHKRLYLGSPTTLWAGTLLWERQRAFRQERAALIATAKAKSNARGWPGSISIVETASSTTGAASAASTADGVGRAESASIGMLIDGQHRLGAAHVLSQRGKLVGALSRILVEVYPPRDETDIKELFTEINRAEPVLLVDLPDESGGASSADNATLTVAAETLRERYPAMFKPSHACRAPHLNVDVLRAEMHKAELLTRYDLTSPAQLIEWLEARNAELAGRPDGDWGAGHADRAKKGTPALENALGKAREQSFFLGLSWDWLHAEALKQS